MSKHTYKPLLVQGRDGALMSYNVTMIYPLPVGRDSLVEAEHFRPDGSCVRLITSVSSLSRSPDPSFWALLPSPLFPWR